jgi:hypothetical protein
MVEMITGAIIAAVFFMLGYWLRGKRTHEKSVVMDDPAKHFRTSKGLLSYKKYISDKGR